jgi:hypothetical protein
VVRRLAASETGILAEVNRNVTLAVEAETNVATEGVRHQDVIGLVRMVPRGVVVGHRMASSSGIDTPHPPGLRQGIVHHLMRT